MTELTPCPSCRRHVLAQETRCPFCECAVAFAVETRPAAPARLGRAATMAFGAAALVAGCSKEAAPTPTPAPGEPHLATASATPPVVVELPDAAVSPAVSGEASATADAGGVKDASAPKWRPPPPRNLAKPYGAPPAAGLRRIV